MNPLSAHPIEEKITSVYTGVSKILVDISFWISLFVSAKGRVDADDESMTTYQLYIKPVIVHLEIFLSPNGRTDAEVILLRCQTDAVLICI